MFTRPEEEDLELPLRIVFLSVEGNKTECQYFNYIEKYRTILGIKRGVHIHPLKRAKNDNNSAPENVLELLEEYMELRDTEGFPPRLRDAIPKNYSFDFVKKYLNNELDSEKDDVNDFELLLKEAGIDLAYSLFLQEYKSDDDIFGIVLDRDYKNHSVSQMKKIISECDAKNYKCFLSTPLFEFWLLLHLVDIYEEYPKNLDDLLINNHVSDKHTYTSKLVSDIAGHSKSISEAVFKQFYLNKIDFAIKQAKKNFPYKINELIGDDSSEESQRGKLGTNIPDLFELLREV